MKTLISFLAVLLLACGAFAQAPAPEFAPAYLFAGAGYSDVSHGFAVAGYAKKTGLFNGSTNFPTYSYSEVRAYRFPFGKSTKQATDFITGLVFPFYARRLLGFDLKLGVGGTVGVSSTPGNVGYSLGAKVIADVTRPSWKRWGILLSADPNRSSVSGIHASQAVAGVRLAFGGF